MIGVRVVAVEDAGSGNLIRSGRSIHTSDPGRLRLGTGQVRSGGTAHVSPASYRAVTVQQLSADGSGKGPIAVQNPTPRSVPARPRLRARRTAYSTTLLIRNHQAVPNTANVTNGPTMFSSRSSRIEKGKSTRNGKNHVQLPSDASSLNSIAMQRHRCSAGKTSESRK